MTQVDPLAPEQVSQVLAQLETLLEAVDAAEREHARALAAIPEPYRSGAQNLVHYVALRQLDVRALQGELAEMGLSSLGRSEGRVRAALASVLRVVARLLGREHPLGAPSPREQASESLAEHTRALLGTREPAAIMVTLPSEAADDPDLVRALVFEGMAVARINCAHDSEPAWVAMAEHVRRACRELDKSCRVLFDLPGPKLRTLPIAEPGYVALSEGELLELAFDPSEGQPARYDDAGRIVRRARISCAVPEVGRALAVGAPVLFDDGKFEARVEARLEDAALLRVTSTNKPGAKLRAEKGMNVPETELDIPALGEEDRQALQVAGEHADLVGLSFARSTEDVESLHRALEALPRPLGVILKIETRRGFENLPSLLLSALQRPPVGVMIARGDLAVECGFERMAELQEEILWLCEAAHVPCIWATQVLETLAKKGRATRAEISDAAMAGRAECVMLNKGPHIVRAVRTLRDINARMRGHQHKKTALLRPLASIRLS